MNPSSPETPVEAAPPKTAQEEKPADAAASSRRSDSMPALAGMLSEVHRMLSQHIGTVKDEPAQPKTRHVDDVGLRISYELYDHSGVVEQHTLDLPFPKAKRPDKIGMLMSTMDNAVRTLFLSQLASDVAHRISEEWARQIEKGPPLALQPESFGAHEDPDIEEDAEEHP